MGRDAAAEIDWIQGDFMFTRREMFCAAVGAALSAGIFAVADQGPIMGSAAIDWSSVPAKPNATGSVRQFFSARTATLEQLEVHVTTLNPGQSPHAPHRHAHEELLIVKQGTLEALIQGEWKRVGPGSVIFFASNQLHGVRNPGPLPAVYDVIAFHTAETAGAQPKAQPAGASSR
jgi:XRE family transcriptional regulator, regulator of sulfur utilization